MPQSHSKLIRRYNASDLILTVMISAVFSLLLIRLFLELTGYRQIGSGQWHIAHILFGGLAMFIGSLITIVFHGEKVRRLSAIFVGFGFGLFIDEAGKFLSANNDYFFEPAIIFIYASFIILFFFYRHIGRQGSNDPRSTLYHIFGRLQDIAENDLEIHEKKWLLTKISRLNNQSLYESGLSLALKRFIRSLHPTPNRPDTFTLIFHQIKSFGYHRIFRRRLVIIILIIIALLYGIDSLASTYRFISNFKNPALLQFFYQDPDLIRSRFHLFFLGSKVFSDLVSSLCFYIGVYLIWIRHHRHGVLLFRYGLLINIFFTSIFRFYFEQFSAVVNLGLSIFLLFGLNRLRRDLPSYPIKIHT